MKGFRFFHLFLSSPEIEVIREWERLAIGGCESRYQAYKNGEMGSVDALDSLETLRARFTK